MAESGGVSPERCAPAGKDAGQTGQIAAGAKETPAKQTEDTRKPDGKRQKPNPYGTQTRPEKDARPAEAASKLSKKGAATARGKTGPTRKEAQGFPPKEAALSRKRGYTPSRNRQRPSGKHAALFPKTCSTFRKKRQGNMQKVLGETRDSPRTFCRETQGLGRSAQRLSTETWSNSARPPCSEAGKSPVNPTQTCGGNGISTE